MGLFSKLFGGKDGGAADAKQGEPEHYKDFLIYPEPIKEAGGFRIAARIECEVDGEVKTHQMVRADTTTSEKEAREVSLHKAQVFIDQMGMGVFG